MTDSEKTTTSTPAPAPAPAPAGADRPRPRPAGGGRSRDDDDRSRGRPGGRRRRVCIMCADHIKYVDYKNVSFLRRFVSDRARIETRRRTSACAKHQRAISNAIKRARHLALLPYTPDHIRISQGR
ncbi:MAG: 30S ribosomal protein S18 [Chloroflexi bacterium]|nr:30S ribosomal protein S18 [Chloroflexota bacterium]